MRLSPRAGAGETGTGPPGSGPDAAAAFRTGWPGCGAEAVRHHAEQHGRRDDGHRLVRHRPSASSASSANTSDASPRGPNQPTNSTVPRSSPAPIEAIATGIMRTTVRLSTAYTSGDGDALDHDRHGDRPEREPHEQRHQPARLLDEDQLGRGRRPAQAAEREPAAEGRDEAVAVQRQRGAVGEERQGQHGDTGEVLGRDPAPASRRSSHPPAPPTATPTAAPISKLHERAACALGALEAGCGCGPAMAA